MVGNGAEIAYSGSEEADIIIPKEISHPNSSVYNVTSIAKYGFMQLKLVGKFELPSSITSGFLAQNNMAIIAPREVTAVNFTGISTVAAYAFAYCKKITNFEIPILEKVGDYAFYLNLSQVTVGNASFAFTEIKGILTLPAILTDSLFESTYVTGELFLSETLTKIPNNIFKKCRVTGELVLPPSLQSIGDFAFYECQ